MAGTVQLSNSCPLCGTRRTVEVSAEAYENWNKRGFLIQHAFPELSEDDRELLLSGICSACWPSE